MEHRRDPRIACSLDVALYRRGVYAGPAVTLNVSPVGLCIRTELELRRNEMVEVVFPEQVRAEGWPPREHALVTHVEPGHAGLWFGERVFRDVAVIERGCHDSHGHPD